jgi:hypothetical protein
MFDFQWYYIVKGFYKMERKNAKIKARNWLFCTLISHKILAGLPLQPAPRNRIKANAAVGGSFKLVPSRRQISAIIMLPQVSK